MYFYIDDLCIGSVLYVYLLQSETPTDSDGWAVVP